MVASVGCQVFAVFSLIGCFRLSFLKAPRALFAQKRYDLFDLSNSSIHGRFQHSCLSEAQLTQVFPERQKIF